MRLLRLASTMIVALALTFLVGGCGDDDDGDGNGAPARTVAEDATAVEPTMALEPLAEVEPVLTRTAIGDIEFTTVALPPDRFVEDVVMTPFGPMMIVETELMWSADALTWYGVQVSRPAERINVVGDDVVVVGDGGVSTLVWEGSRWAEDRTVDRIGQVLQIASGPRGVVVYGPRTIYHSSDGVTFTEAGRGPRSDVFVAPEWVPAEDRDFGDCRQNFGATTNRIDHVLATDAGFVAFTSAAGSHDTCDPLLWFSSDGDTWELVSESSPLGELSVVFVDSGVAARNGRFVVNGEIGGQGVTDSEPSIWTSEDGLTWDRHTGPAGRTVDVFAGEMGWMLLGSADAETGPTLAWFSTDGISWDGPHVPPEGFSGLRRSWIPTRHAIGVDTMIAVGSVDDRPVVVVGRLVGPET